RRWESDGELLGAKSVIHQGVASLLAMPGNRRRCRAVEVVTIQDGEKIGVVPAPVAPILLSGDSLVMVAALLVHAPHRWVHRLTFDAVQAQLLEGEAGANADGVGCITATPCLFLANGEATGSTAVLSVDFV